MIEIFYHGNLKDCLMDILSLLLHIIVNLLLHPLVDYIGTNARVKFNGDSLKQEKNTFNHGKIVKIYICFEIKWSVCISSYPMLEKCLFGAVKLTKLDDVDLYKYLGYGIEFDWKGFYSIVNEVCRSYARIRTYTDCRKIVFIQLF